VLGPDEATRGVVKLKDMKSGEEWTLALDEIAARLRAR
jgi:histidyl-tRNA synthetase